jgi:hypothetical protein
MWWSFEPGREDDEPTSRQVGIALRFIDPLAALSPEQRATIQNTQDLDVYVAAVQQVRAVVDRMEAEYRFEHPTGGRRAFAERADHHLDEIGIVDELWLLAREAVRAILVWDQPDVEHSCWLVYQPFEDVIPKASIE